jgi:Fe-S-cluster-containing hydrogenase component 2
MAAQVDPTKCKKCGGVIQPLCVEACPDEAIRVQGDRIVVTEFLCEDCNECGFVCPDHAISIPLDKVTF